jgi:hypothetical protein
MSLVSATELGVPRTSMTTLSRSTSRHPIGPWATGEHADQRISMRANNARYSACENVLLIATTRLPTQRSILDRNEDPGRADADSFAAARALGRG